MFYTPMATSCYLFSTCFQELQTTNPSTTSTSQPISHSTKEVGSGPTEHLQMMAGIFFTSFQSYAEKWVSIVLPYS